MSTLQVPPSGRPLDLLSFNLGQSALIEASAGTGKTYTITYLIVRLLLNAGRSGNLEQALLLDQILVVTFTNAAAADLKTRIREKIREARQCLLTAAAGESISSFEPLMQELCALLQDNCARSTQGGLALSLQDYVRLLQRAERDIDKAAICTIHSFCYSALNQIYAFEAGEAFETQLCQDVSALQEEAFISTWRSCFYAQDEAALLPELEVLGSNDPRALLPLYATLEQVRASQHRPGMVLNFALKDNTQYLDTRKREARTLFKELRLQLRSAAAAQKLQLAALQRELQQLLAPYTAQLPALLHKEFCSLLQQGPDKFAKLKNPAIILLQKVQAFVADPAAAAAFSASDFKLCAEDTDLWLNNAASNLKKLKDPDTYSQLRRRICQGLNQLATLNAQRTAWSLEFKTALCLLADAKFNELKAQRQQISLDDVLLRLDKALQQPKGRGEQLAAMIRARYPIAMVDEFQDTDPVQYAIFEQIYLQKDTAASARCYLIGDPKQSIYSFRGSDINSYLKARARIIECSGPESIYTLATNYRSAKAAVEAVNALFGSTLNSANHCPFYLPEVAFTPVQSTQGKMQFHFADQADVGCLIFVSGREACTKDALLTRQAEACAQQVVRVLTHGRLTLKSGEERTVRPNDIAILVRSAKESSAIVQALARHQVGAVFYSDRSSVLGSAQEPSAEAQDMRYLMEALCDPADRAAVVRLLGSTLLSLEGAQFRELLADAQFEQEVRLLTQLQTVWQHNGFLSAFMQWLQAPSHQGLQRSMQFVGGERRLTNYQHIAEIMQQQHGIIKGIKAQLRWYTQLLQGNDVTDNPDEFLKRLESERAQVRIYTIHKSKGLEFPLVMLPYLWLCDRPERGKGKPILYYDAALKRRQLDLYAQADSAAATAALELQEDMRLTYVALTRACACNFIFLAQTRSSADLKPRSFMYLLSGCNEAAGQPAPLGDALPAALQNLHQRPDLFTLSELPADFMEQAPTLWNPPPEPSAALHADTLPPQACDDNFTISSYSGLVSGLHDTAVSSEQSERDERAEGSLELPPRLSPFDFPRGTQAGSLLHLLLERCDFAALNHCPPAEQLSQLRALCTDISSSPYAQVFAAWTAHLGDGIEALAQWLFNMVNARLPTADGGTFCLSELPANAFVPEMRYLMPVTHLDSTKLNALCLDSAADVPQLNGITPALYLESRQVNGFLTGSLDLVCRSGQPGHERYYVIDYKSTFLGSTYAAYSDKQVAASVFDPRNRYDVQYLIYTAALHRLLKVRLPNYDYAKDIGGVLYLYLRGLRADVSLSPGVFFTKPQQGIVERLDALLGEAND